MRTSMIDIATLAGIHDATIELCTQVILGCHLFDSIDHHVVVDTQVVGVESETVSQGMVVVLAHSVQSGHTGNVVTREGLSSVPSHGLIPTLTRIKIHGGIKILDKQRVRFEIRRAKGVMDTGAHGVRENGQLGEFAGSYHLHKFRNNVAVAVHHLEGAGGMYGGRQVGEGGVKSPFRLRKIHFDPFSISNDRQHGGRRETQGPHSLVRSTLQ